MKQLDLQLTTGNNNGKKGSPTMEVAWSVWIKGDTKTKYKPLLKPNGFEKAKERGQIIEN